MKLRDYFELPGAMSKIEMARRIGKTKGYITGLCNEEIVPHSPVALQIIELCDDLVTLEDLVPQDRRIPILDTPKQPETTLTPAPSTHVVGVGELVTE